MCSESDVHPLMHVIRLSCVPSRISLVIIMYCNLHVSHSVLIPKASNGTSSSEANTVKGSGLVCHVTVPVTRGYCLRHTPVRACDSRAKIEIFSHT